jgi:hypothetical protein
MDTRASPAIRHLLVRLQPIHRLITAAYQDHAATVAQRERPEVSDLCMSAADAERLLVETEARLSESDDGVEVDLTAEEVEQEAELRAEAKTLGRALPLDRLSDELALSPFELQALLICAASDVDSAFGAMFAYLLDDMGRKLASVELIASLVARGDAERLNKRTALGRFARLRRIGLLEAIGVAASEGRQELRLNEGVLGFLIGEHDDLGRFCDPAEISLPAAAHLPGDLDREKIEQVARAIAAGEVGVVGVWGALSDGQEDVVAALACFTGRSLRRFRPSAADTQVRDAIAAAAATSALLWIGADELAAPTQDQLRAQLAAELGRTRVAACLSGIHPWRPARLLAARPYVELILPPSSFGARKRLWKTELPELTDDSAGDYAARFRVSRADLTAMGNTARAAAGLDSGDLPRALPAAAAMVVRRRVAQVARVIEPSRRATDLVLAPDVHRQVIEVARFFRAWPRIAEEWELARTLSSSYGLKALFTGDPGTGKTLAAEVVAGDVGLPLFKVDLASVVSKWVGETEKNLDSVFREAEESHSVLFFDEAEALFGKRGEVQHGTDRYANLEISYLLQRLEEYDGLVILASNLKDQIDVAFTRRFHVLLHFPRPREAERLRIWQQTLPPGIVDRDVDIGCLSRLDLTGAGIVGAVRTAALLAGQAEASSIAMRHLIEAIARQFRREARVLTPADLGPYRSLLGAIT